MQKSVLYSITAMIIYFMTLHGARSIATFVIVREEFLNLGDHYFELAESVIYLLLIFLSYWFIKRYIKATKSIGVSFKNLGFVLFLVLLYRVIEDPILRINEIVNPSDLPIFLENEFVLSSSTVIAALNLVILAALFEELFFRQIILSFFRKNDLGIGVLLSSFLFALIHIKGWNFDSIVFFTAYIFGVVASLIYLRYGILYSVLFHSGYNLLWLFLGIEKKGYWETLSYLSFDYRYWLIILVSLIGFTFLVFPLLKYLDRKM